MSRLRLGPQRVCPRCGELSPSAGGGCDHCGAAFTSDLRWKVPLIVLLFLIAFAVTIAVEVLA